MKYTLNKTPIRTTNNFKINDISVDINYNETDFNKYKVNCSYSEEIKNNFDSKIGLSHEKYLLLNTDIKEDNVDIEYNFDDNNYLVSEIVLNINTNSNVIINFNSNKESFLNLKIVINTINKVKGNITLINNLNDDSTSLISFENNINNDSKIILNYIDITGSKRISNIYSTINDDSSFELNNIYLGRNNDLIDMNYYSDNIGKRSKSNMNIYGVLKDESKKSIKFTIDFKKDSKKSIGKEKENVLLLSSKVVSKSCPIILCNEEDVYGTHSVSSGKIDKDKLFYLMSRGISNEEAIKMIVFSNFNKVVKKINNEKMEKLVYEKLEKII